MNTADIHLSLDPTVVSVRGAFLYDPKYFQLLLDLSQRVSVFPHLWKELHP